MARRIRNFVLPLIVSLVLVSTACTDLTSPRSQDVPQPSFTEGQDSTFTQGQGDD